MKKRYSLDTILPLILLGIIFLVMYLPVINRPIHFEEIKITRAFHTPPPANKVFTSEDTFQGSQLNSLWKEYLRIRPPGLIAFYWPWTRVSFENETLMRLPLLILVLLCFQQVFQFFSQVTDHKEAAVVTLLFSLSTLWYSLGTLLLPENFAAFLTFLSIGLYYHSLRKKSLSVALFIVNILALSVSYYFAIIVLIQMSCLSLVSNIPNKKKFILTFGLLIFAASIAYYNIPNRNHSNPLTFYWPKVDAKNTLSLIKYILLGSIR